MSKTAGQPRMTSPNPTPVLHDANALHDAFA